MFGRRQPDPADHQGRQQASRRHGQSQAREAVFDAYRVCGEQGGGQGQAQKDHDHHRHGQHGRPLPFQHAVAAAKEGRQGGRDAHQRIHLLQPKHPPVHQQSAQHLQQDVGQQRNSSSDQAVFDHPIRQRHDNL